MCNKIDGFLPALKFVSNWFVTSTIITGLLTALYADENILYFNEDSGTVIFSYNEIGILNIDLNNIYTDDTNYDEDNPGTIIFVRLLAWKIKFKKREALKKR